MGALYLKPLDDRMAALGCVYVRYMDDWVVLASTRWKLRAAIRAVNQVMANLRVRQHPDKTIIGRIARGFDFLGYRFSAAGLAVARQTVERCAARMSQLYEQGAAMSRIGDYVRRWARWVRAGLGGGVGSATGHDEWDERERHPVFVLCAARFRAACGCLSTTNKSIVMPDPKPRTIVGRKAAWNK